MLRIDAVASKPTPEELLAAISNRTAGQDLWGPHAISEYELESGLLYLLMTIFTVLGHVILCMEPICNFLSYTTFPMGVNVLIMYYQKRLLSIEANLRPLTRNAIYSSKFHPQLHTYPPVEIHAAYTQSLN